MNSLTLLRFAFAYSMSKIAIITKDREIEYQREVRTGFLARYLSFTVSPERRCSSRTFRYGYLVTT